MVGIDKVTGRLVNKGEGVVQRGNTGTWGNKRQLQSRHDSAG